VKKKILVVDDDYDLLEQLKMMLAAAGYDVTAAEGRAAAEEELLKMKPALVVCDLMMEEKDAGFVLSHQIQKLYPGTPVILLTAVAGATGLSFNSQDAEAQSWIKINKVLDKPVRPEQLKEEIRRLLQEPSDEGAGAH
jgi:CheY-like chemotaxis protein